MIPPLDADLLRVKLISEIEQPYKQQIEAKNMEFEKMNETLARSLRSYEILNQKYE